MCSIALAVRRRSGRNVGTPRSAAQIATGGSTSLPREPTRRRAVTTAGRSTRGCSARAETMGTANEPVPRKIVRALPFKRGWSRERRQLRVVFRFELLVHLLDGHELVHRVEIVDVELAVEVVDLVLQRARQQTVAVDLDLPSVPVLCDHPHLFAPRDPGDVARDRQTTLEIAVVALALNQTRIDELMDVAADFDDGDLQRNAHLRRRQSHPGRGTHRLGQVVEQAVEVPAKSVDGLANEAQPGVAECQDRDHSHGGEYMESGADGSCATSITPATSVCYNRLSGSTSTDHGTPGSPPSTASGSAPRSTMWKRHLPARRAT